MEESKVTLTLPGISLTPIDKEIIKNKLLTTILEEVRAKEQASTQGIGFGLNFGLG